MYKIGMVPENTYFTFKLHGQHMFVVDFITDKFDKRLVLF